ncbi:MAG: exodeoxyribonuclease VII small subunit [Kangiellaceae bacterium]|nr:exodeoxyribonuclease VII small subunit [Kangiellaceae bacterium]
MNTKKKPSFESQLAALEEIVNHLEKGDLPLDESLTQFEKGVKLTAECQSILNEAEQKVSILSNNEQDLEEFE